MPARLARFDRWRVRELAGEDIGLPPGSAVPPPRLVGYQFARLPVAAALAFLVYLWWSNAVQLLLLPVLQPTGALVFFDYRLGEVSLSPGGVALGSALGFAFVFAGAQIVRAVPAVDARLARWLLGPSRPTVLPDREADPGPGTGRGGGRSERRRIERDLHDGFQPKLVSLAAQLGLAMVRFDRIPPRPVAARPGAR